MKKEGQQYYNYFSIGCRGDKWLENLYSLLPWALRVQSKVIRKVAHTLLMNQRMNQDRWRWVKRNHSCAKGSWKMDTALMRRSVNLLMGHTNYERTTNLIPSIKQSNVEASKTSNFVSMEIDAISSILMFQSIYRDNGASKAVHTWMWRWKWLEQWIEKLLDCFRLSSERLISWYFKVILFKYTIMRIMAILSPNPRLLIM